MSNCLCCINYAASVIVTGDSMILTFDVPPLATDKDYVRDFKPTSP